MKIASLAKAKIMRFFLERVLECAARVLCGKKSKIGEVFFGFACYTSHEC